MIDGKIGEGLSLTAISIGIVAFLVIFVTKLQGYIDVPIIVGLMFLLLASLKQRLFYPKSLIPYTAFLFVISTYAIFISLVYGFNEIIFALKFVHTLLLLFLLYFVWLEVKDHISYDEFTKYFVIMVTIHSIIILSAIVFPDFRHALYSVTGYVPRGPEWSRSPGLTISFNATAIVHVTGLWLLLSKKDWSTWKRWCLALLILSSLAFLGRFVGFIGILLIAVFLLLRFNWKQLILSAVVIVGCLPLLVGWVSDMKIDTSTVQGQLLSNYHHFIDPLMGIGGEKGADRYLSDNLYKHIYFSDKWQVLIFGNSYAGHIGMMKGSSGIGETDSDLGLINSINANGIIITASIYIFYLLLIWAVRKKDWQPVAIVVLLSLVLSFKETGLFTSHATPLLFLLFFYQLFSDPSESHKRDTI